ncbi:MAG TPA: hypothetical protein VM933_06345, partial [Acidimicrobiales bacterium]|nr:hypothetical protein [Acidimicrobiales bacterium]
ALVVGLFVRGLEIHGVLPGSKPAALVASHAAPSDPIRVPGGARVPLLPTRLALRELRARDFAPALSLLGLAAFAALLWVRFGDPLVFSKVSSAPGWGKAFDVESLLKLHLFRLLDAYGLNLVTFWLVVQGLLALVALGLVPAVARRVGWGYATYVLVVVGIAFASTRDFIGMGRYVLVAFPAFAAAADLLLGWASRARGRAGARAVLARSAPTAALVVSTVLLAWMVSLFARWHFLS